MERWYTAVFPAVEAFLEVSFPTWIQRSYRLQKRTKFSITITETKHRL